MAGDVPVWPDNMALMTVKGGCLQVLNISPVTIPIDILFFSFRIYMLTIGNIKLSVIVPWIINTMFSRSAIMPGCSHLSAFPLSSFCIFLFPFCLSLRSFHYLPLAFQKLFHVAVITQNSFR